MSDHKRYLGMGIHDALAMAIKGGEQMRVLADGARALRYAEPAHESHIQVKIKQGIIVSVHS